MAAAVESCYKNRAAAPDKAADGDPVAEHQQIQLLLLLLCPAGRGAAAAAVTKVGGADHVVAAAKNSTLTAAVTAVAPPPGSGFFGASSCGARLFQVGVYIHPRILMWRLLAYHYGHVKV